MRSEPVRVPVEELCSIVTSGGTPSRKEAGYWENGQIPWFKTGELNDWYLSDSEEKITADGLQHSSAKLFPPNTVLMAMYGDGKTITSLGLLKREAATNQACCAMIADEDVCDPLYLFYALKHHRHELLQLVVAGAQRNLSGGIIKRFPVTIFPIEQQRRIADILSAYDDLIENNRRRIALLEEAARQLYREWFVRLRFPGHEHTKIVDGLPEGWNICGIRAAYDGLFDGPHATPAPSDEGPVFLGIKNVLEVGGLDLSSIRHVSEADFPTWTRRVTPMQGDIVFSYEATLNRYALIPRGLRCCLGRRMALIRPKDEYRYFLYLHMFSENWRQVIAGRAITGATVDRIPLTSFPDFPLALPTEKLCASLNEAMEPNFRLIENLREQNQKLAEARDLLLPRLMDGRISV